MVHTVWASPKNGYLISIDGLVRSVDRVHTITRKGSTKPYKRVLKGKVLEQRNNPKGYHRVQLGRGKEMYVHRLVLDTFKDKRDYPKWQCNHKNKDISDNRIENLEWLTQTDNMRHAHGWKGY